jgi:hypothetical protein
MILIKRIPLQGGLYFLWLWLTCGPEFERILIRGRAAEDVRQFWIIREGPSGDDLHRRENKPLLRDKLPRLSLSFRVVPLARFHLQENVNATRDFILKRDSENYWLQYAMCYAILNRFLLHVINGLLLTAKCDSLLVKCRLRIGFPHVYDNRWLHTADSLPKPNQGCRTGPHVRRSAVVRSIIFFSLPKKNPKCQKNRVKH